jgi:hypothetical protein
MTGHQLNRVRGHDLSQILVTFERVSLLCILGKVNSP